MPQKLNGAPGRTRIPNLLIRSQVLYPIELQAHSFRAEDFTLARRSRQVFLPPNGPLLKLAGG
jgi:hypothetical protein